MKTFFWSLLTILYSIQGHCDEFISQPLCEFKTGYFFFSDSKMRKVYDSGGLDVQLCGSTPLWNLCSQWDLNAYAAIEYFQRSGESLNGDQKTSVWSVPVNVGLKAVRAIDCDSQYYVAMGPRYLYLHQHNHSSYVNKDNSEKSLGFFVNTGLHYFLCNQLVVDVFGEYSYAKVKFHSGNSRVYTRNIQMGGFTFGGGLGYTF